MAHSGRGHELRLLMLAVFACLPACAWLGSRKHEPPEPTQIIVTGAPAGSVVFIDGSPSAQPVAVSDHPQVLDVSAGAHQVEIHADEKVVYREDTYVNAGEHRVVTVLSGLSR